MVGWDDSPNHANPPYMSAGHLPPALSAVYTETLSLFMPMTVPGVNFFPTQVS
jgi:hypothetical protein